MSECRANVVGIGLGVRGEVVEGATVMWSQSDEGPRWSLPLWGFGQANQGLRRLL